MVWPPKNRSSLRLEPNPLECWDDESTASALRALAVRLHSTGLSLRETAAALEQFGVFRSHQAVLQWVHRIAEKAPDPPTAKPSRVAVDETAVEDRHEQSLAVRRDRRRYETSARCASSRAAGYATRQPSFSASWPRDTTSLRRRFSWTGWAI